MKNNLKIAFISPGDPHDKRSWSGTSYFIMKALEKYVGGTDWVCPIPLSFMRHRKLWAKIKFLISGTRHFPERTLKVSQYCAEQISKELTNNRYDIIFAPVASFEIAYLKTSIPIVYISDATFSLLKNIYPTFSNLTNETQKAEEFFEQSAINSSSLLIYPSYWAADASVRDYGAEPSKIRVIPFGANLDSIPDKKEITRKKIYGRVNILFLGKEWDRKGGPIAVETLENLLDMGVRAKLTVCGVVPPEKYAHPHCEVIPYLDKNSKDQQERLQKIISESHILLVPSRAECYGVVFCEANAYGLPVFAADVGGISSIVQNGVNGYLLPLEAGGREFAAKIAEISRDKYKYSSMVENSRKRYEQTLNWDAWGKSMRQMVDSTFGI